MHKVLFSQSARFSISRYIKQYRDLFVKLYTDTGLGIAEEIIKDNYNTTAKTLAKNIKNLTESHMRSVDILGYAPKAGDIRETTLSIENRRIYIQYIEDPIIQTRYIHDIRIERK